MRRRGYERDGAPNVRLLEAVRWWYVRSQEGFMFARGGRVETTRIARAQLRAADDRYDHELREWRKRPTHILGERGELIEIHRSVRG